MSHRFFVFILLTIALAVTVGNTVQAQIGTPEVVDEIPRYYQAETLADVEYALCPYAQQQTAINQFDEFNLWMASHSTPEGKIIRAESIDFDCIRFLNVFLGNNDCVGLWHQVYYYGPITDFHTLSKIKTVSLNSEKSREEPKPVWCISENEALMIMTYVALRMGTYNNKWPYLDE